MFVSVIPHQAHSAGPVMPVQGLLIEAHQLHQVALVERHLGLIELPVPDVAWFVFGQVASRQQKYLDLAPAATHQPAGESAPTAVHHLETIVPIGAHHLEHSVTVEVDRAGDCQSAPATSARGLSSVQAEALVAPDPDLLDSGLPPSHHLQGGLETQS